MKISDHVAALARLSSLQRPPTSPRDVASARAAESGGDVATSPRCPGREDKSARGRVEVDSGGGGNGDGDCPGGGGHDGGDTLEVAEKEESPPASETVEPTAVFDVASLVLYGSRALPIRLKILLDLLFNQLPNAKVTRLLAAFGWTHEDYSRGYILQVSRWTFYIFLYLSLYLVEIFVLILIVAFTLTLTHSIYKILYSESNQFFFFFRN